MAGTPPPGREKRPPSAQRAYAEGMAEAGPYLTVGIQLAGAMAMFVLGGYFADRWLGTSPWLLLVGALLGAVASFYTLLRLVKQLDERQKARDKGRQRPGDPRGGGRA